MSSSFRKARTASRSRAQSVSHTSATLRSLPTASLWADIASSIDDGGALPLGGVEADVRFEALRGAAGEASGARGALSGVLGTFQGGGGGMSEELSPVMSKDDGLENLDI